MYLERIVNRSLHKLARFASRRSKKFPIYAYTINGPEGEDYLTRIHFPRIFNIRPMLHYFHRHDLDRDPHNHPWKWAVSIILMGGYIERRFNPNCFAPGPFKERPENRVVRPLSVNLVKDNTFHMVRALLHPEGCWTLFIAGPRIQTWGFKSLEDGQFIKWDKYLEV